MGEKRLKKSVKISILILALISFSFFIFSDNLSIQTAEQTISRQELPSSFSGKIHNSIIQEIQDNPDKTIEAIIQLKQDNFDQVKTILENNGVQNINQFEVGDIITADIPAQVLEELSQDEDINSIWPNLEYSILLDNSHEQLNTNIAWNLDLKGDNIKIAILDTGISHIDFQDRIIAQKAFTGEDHTSDGQGHGTHVAGIAAADGLYKGVAPNSLLLNAKVLTDKGGGSTKTILEGINWAVENDADIISMSLGGPYSDPDGPINSALLEAINQGITVVLASGNCNLGCGSFKGVTTPGDLKEAITVGAIDENNNIASFSSRQDFTTYSKPEILAPGVSIISTVPTDSYAEKSGTSMSTPFITGVAALLKQQDNTLTHSEIKQLLIENSDGGILDLSKLFKEQEQEIIEEPEETPEQEIIEEPEETSNETPEKTCEDYFLDTPLVSENPVECQKVFEENESLVFIKITKLNSSDDSSKYLVSQYTGDYFNSIVTQYETYYILQEENKIIWSYKDLLFEFTISDKYQETLLTYLQTYPSDIKDNLDNTIIQIKTHELLYTPVEDKQPTDYELNPQGLQKEISTSDYQIQATVCSDYSGSYGSCSKEGAYTKSGTSVYECTDFKWGYGQILCWEKYSSKGDSSYCTDAYKKAGSVCYRNEYDCDANYECSGSLVCDDQGWFDGDGCCYSDEVWNGDYCEKGCSEGKTGNKECGFGNVLKAEYSDKYCSTSLVKEKDCDDSDSVSYGGLTCIDGDVKKKKTTTDYYCQESGSSASCVSTSSANYNLVESCDNGCSAGACLECTSDSHCGSGEACQNNVCKAVTCSSLGKPASCSYTEYLLGYSACISDDPTKCQKFGNIYCYDYTDTCTGSEFCDENGAGDSICKEVPCVITSATWSPTSAKEGDTVKLTATSSTCAGKTAHFEIFESDSCTTSIENYDSNLTTPEEFIQQNNIDTEGKSAEEYLAQCFSTEHIKTIGPISFSSGKFETTWKTTWIPDIIGDPEYFFKVLVDGTIKKESAELPVSFCPDKDGDGYGICKGDCDDTDAKIHPGATESCNLKDDNCNAVIDDGDVCLELTCGNNVCDSKETATNCPADCKANFVIDSITSISKSSANPGDSLTFTALVKNTGSSSGAIFVEGAIVPDSWRNIYYSDIDSQAVYDNPYPICEENTYYDYKIVEIDKGKSEYVTFSVIVPHDKSVDECSSDKLSAWDTEFNLLVGTYAAASGGEHIDSYYKKFMVNTGACASIDGSSDECSCITQDCGPGFTCDIGSEACVPVSNCEQADGSSADCDCNSNSQCFAGYKCEFGPGWDACVEVDLPDECEEIDKYSCKDGDVYRCETVDGRKQLLLSDICTVTEYCPQDIETTKACKTAINYDLKLEQASSKTIINKQSGDTLTIQIDTADASLELTYDDSAFIGSCGPFNLGINICEFEVVGEPGKYLFKLNDDVEVVKIIDNPSGIYITNIEQLNSRYKDTQGVAVLLAKTFEKAAENKGLVYDLNKEISLAQKFDDFDDYNEPLSCKQDNNDFAISTADLVQEKCNGCKQVIIIGDDYIVPSYRATVNIEEGIDFSGLFDSTTTKETFYSDNYLSSYNYNLDFSNLDDVFSRGEGFEGKKTTIIIPESATSEQEELYNSLKDILAKEKPFEADVRVVSSSTVSCNDFDLFNSFNARSLIIIGDHTNNQAFNCYPHFDLETVQDSLIIDRSVWDGDESAILIGSDTGVQALTTIIKEGTWKELKSSDLYVISNTVSGVSYVLLIGGLAGAGGATAASGGALVFLLSYADTASDALEILNDCAIIYDSSMCKISTASVGIPLLSAKYGKAAFNTFKEIVGDLVSTNMIKKHGTDLFTFLGKLYFKDSSEVTKFATNYKKVNEYLGKEADEVLSKAAKTMDDEYHIAKGAGVLEKEGKTLTDFYPKADTLIVKAEALKQLGKIASKHGDEFANKITELQHIKGFDVHIKNIASGSKGFKHEGDVALAVKSKLKELSVDIKDASGKQIGEFDMLLDNGDILETKQGWGTLMKGTDYASSKKWDDQIKSFNSQISRYTDVIKKSDKPDAKVKFVFDSDVTNDLMNFFKEKGVEVWKVVDGVFSPAGVL